MSEDESDLSSEDREHCRKFMDTTYTIGMLTAYNGIGPETLSQCLGIIAGRLTNNLERFTELRPGSGFDTLADLCKSDMEKYFDYGYELAKKMDNPEVETPNGS